MKSRTRLPAILTLSVIAGSLGCFVDSFDLVLFSLLRIPSLRAIGVPEGQLADVGILLLDLQMAGMLIGGLVWGMLGDRRGRVSVLFGSILLYSAANFANAFVTTVPVYGALRVLAGLGLAGETGAAVTLVSEQLARHDRGYGTMLIAFMGALGGLAASGAAEWLSWQSCYLAGGVLGFLLLALRLGMRESDAFTRAAARASPRGDFTRLVRTPRRALRYLSCILLGVPAWYVVGLLVGFAPELNAELKRGAAVSVAQAFLYTQLGAISGDLTSSIASQLSRARKKVIAGFLGLSAASCALYLALPLERASSPAVWAVLFFALGFGNGYWSVLITLIAESFGTDLRNTATTSAPNFVRAALVVMTAALKLLRPRVGIAAGVTLIGAAVFIGAAAALAVLDETYGVKLDFLEGEPTRFPSP